MWRVKECPADVHIYTYVYFLYIAYLYMHIRLHVPDMPKHVFMSHLYVFWGALYVYSFHFMYIYSRDMNWGVNYLG